MTRSLAPRPLVRREDIAPQPWQNGGGTARTLFSWPKSDQWRLRVSLADIAADGPFSRYPGVQRWFAIADGAGVELSVAGALHRVQRDSAAIVFAGRESTVCRRLGGNSTAINLMLRGVSGSMRRLVAKSAWMPRAPAFGLYASTAGACRFVNEEIDVPAGALVWFDMAPPMVWFGGEAFGFEIGVKTPPPEDEAGEANEADEG